MNTTTLALFVVLGMVLLGIVMLIAAKLGLYKPGGPAVERFPFQVEDRLLSQSEQAFYSVLLPALPRSVVILQRQGLPLLLAKVRLGDILTVGYIEGSEGKSKNQSFRNKIDRKHVDFLLCHPQTTKPLLVIELDDSSHQHQRRQDRDAFVDKACAAAGLEILHIRAAASYDPEDLAKRIATHLAPKPVPVT